jgi:hypothetical protein
MKLIEERSEKAKEIHELGDQLTALWAIIKNHPDIKLANSNI